MVLNSNQPKLEEIMPLVEQLPMNAKIELVEKLLGKQSGLSVVLGNNQVSDSIMVQIKMADRGTMADILQAIAERIAREGK